MRTFSAAVLAVLGLLCFPSSGVEARNRVMPWMCLERCSDNITADISEMFAHKQYLTAVSFEAYDLGTDGLLVNNGFYNIMPDLKEAGLDSYPMITTADIDSLRLLFEKTFDQFITAAVAAAKANGYTGFNIDFEPCQYHKTCTSADASAFATFLTKFADALHAEGVQLTVDVASWSPFWDFDLLAKSSVDKVMSMDTYGLTDEEFERGLIRIMGAFNNDTERIGIGLCPSCGTVPSEGLSYRASLLKQNNIQEIDIWKAPIPEVGWMPFVEAFANESR